MATVDIKYENDLLIVTITGNVTFNEMVDVILEHYKSTITMDVIWDLTNGSMRLISDIDLKKIATMAKKAVTGRSRQGSKTAFVGNSDGEHAILRLYTVIAEITGVPVKYNVFMTMEDARCWIERN
jgi:hypothetical protein